MKQPLSRFAGDSQNGYPKWHIDVTQQRSLNREDSLKHTIAPIWVNIVFTGPIDFIARQANDGAPCPHQRKQKRIGAGSDD